MKGLILTICSLAITFCAFAQQDTYEAAKIKVMENLRSGDFASAKSRLNLMEPDIDESNRNEYENLLKQLQNSINDVYGKAHALRATMQYQRAINEYLRLVGRNKEPLIQPLYTLIGSCYEDLSLKELARSYYELGLKYKEEGAIEGINRLSQSPKGNGSVVPVAVPVERRIVVEPSKTFWEKVGECWEEVCDILEPEDDYYRAEYIYSKAFPFSYSYTKTTDIWSVGGEMGFNFEGKEYHSQKYDPTAYLLYTPGVYFRLFSFNCGIGTLMSTHKKTKIEPVTDESSTISISYLYSWTAVKFDLMLKPNMTICIPFWDDEYFITLSAGYNYIPRYEDLSGWSFGIGFQREIW